MMLYNHSIQNKIDSQLKAKLDSASDDTSLRVIAIIGKPTVLRGMHDESLAQTALQQNSNASRAELIAKRKRLLEREFEDIFEDLRNLSLTPKGGTLTHTIVLEGTARQIVNALALSAVRYASLDSTISLLTQYG